MQRRKYQARLNEKTNDRVKRLVAYALHGDDPYLSLEGALEDAQRWLTDDEGLVDFGQWDNTGLPGVLRAHCHGKDTRYPKLPDGPLMDALDRARAAGDVEGLWEYL
jgi:hypothetical protein